LKHWLTVGAVMTVAAFAAAPSQAQDAPSAIVEQLAAKDVLSGDDLVVLAERVGAGDTTDMAALVGKPFRVVVTPNQTTAEGPRWWYDKAQQALGLHASIGRLSGDFFTRPGCADGATARGIEIDRAELNQRRVGQTPDGDRHMYDQRRQYRVSLGRLECSASAAPSGLNVSLSESRKVADTLTPTLQATIEGRLQLADGQALVVCAAQRTTATTDKPTELDIRQCVVGAAIQRIGFTANGGELASWSAADDRTAASELAGSTR
jgi:hypothetical protein